jgi:hypothetical protein
MPPGLQLAVAQSLPVAHLAPTAHRLTGAQVPPQSVSVSAPFRIPSVQEGGWQIPSGPMPAQIPLAQSPARWQRWPLAQGEQPDPPPQSRSDSAPFSMPSPQLALWHSPPEQLASMQSPACAQVFPAPQAGHPEVGPPQSTSDSPPFRTRSVHEATVQRRSTQSRLAQSPPAAQDLPAEQGAQGPPQSTSDSPPFDCWSSQDARAASAASGPDIEPPPSSPAPISTRA